MRPVKDRLFAWILGLGAAPFCLVECGRGLGSLSFSRKLLERTAVRVPDTRPFG